MKDPMRLVARFAYKHPRFGVKHLMRYLVGCCVLIWLMFLLMDAKGSSALMSLLVFDFEKICRGQIWRLFSFLFIPVTGNSLLALITFYFYYWMGELLEQYWGTVQFNLYLLLGWFFTVLFGVAMGIFGGPFYSVTTGLAMSGHYLFLSLFFAVATLFPDMQVYLFMIIPVKMKWLALLDLALFVYNIVRSGFLFPLNMLPAVALLNYLVFFGVELWNRRPRKRSDTVVNFRRETARIRREEERTRREQKDQLYHHKCAVCGRTDATNPELEFRYCSRCAGYHCFCEEHINNHIHFTE